MKLRDAYVASRRVWIASNVASLCAAGLLIGLIGSGLTWFDRSALFDLAQNSLGTVKIGLGFLAGPVAIIFAMPFVFARPHQTTLTRLYRTRILVAAALWVAGLVILISKVSDLDGYTLTAGTYVAAGLLLVGLGATLAMWPSGLEVVAVNRKGVIRGPASARRAT
jgi:cytochrome bd-type quinol oxidase subunit 2